MRKTAFIFWLCSITLTVCSQPGKQQQNTATRDEAWREKAKKMVENQITDRGVKDDRVINAMKNTPRHLFVPPPYRGQAYQDRPLPIGHGQTISQPYIVALMTELLNLDGDEKVLEIGTGSGYQAAILAKLAKQVYSIEVVKALAESSDELLKRLGHENVEVKYGDGYQGWPQHAPFDRIILTAAPKETPPKLVEQLKPGGIMVLPEGADLQKLKIITKNEDGSINTRTKGFVRFVPMVKP